jgi:hypothetical protein
MKLHRAIAVLIGGYLLLVLCDRFVLVELLARRAGIPLLLAALAALAAIGAGFVARGPRLQHRPDLPLDLLLGLPLFGTACFLIGVLNVSIASMALPLLLFAAAGALAVRRSRIAHRQEEPVHEQRTPNNEQRTAIAAIVIVFVAAVIAAQAPPATLDELAYHLAVPWTWVKEARAIELPLVSHSYFPLGVESASLPLLTMLGNTAGGIASHLLHLAAAMATTILIARRTRDLLLTAAIVATPALALTAGWSLVDWPLLGICVALVTALDEGDDAMLAAALAAGLLTKYTFIPIAAIAVLAQWRMRIRWRPLLIGLALGSVFFLRNLVLTANPFAPFFSAAAPHVAGYREPAYLSDYVFDGHFIDESLGASLLAAAVATSGALGWLLFAAGAALFALSPSARILLPFFAVAATRVRELARVRALRVILAIAVVLQLMLIAFVVERGDAFSLLAGRATDEEYLRRQRPSVQTIRALDAALPANSRTLIIGLNETYWFERHVRGGGNFDGPRVSRYLDLPTAEALYARLRADGITHVAVIAAPHATTIARKLEERETTLTPQAQRALALTLDHFAANVSAPGSNAALFALK